MAEEGERGRKNGKKEEIIVMNIAEAANRSRFCYISTSYLLLKELSNARQLFDTGKQEQTFLF